VYSGVKVQFPFHVLVTAPSSRYTVRDVDLAMKGAFGPLAKVEEAPCAWDTPPGYLKVTALIPLEKLETKDGSDQDSCASDPGSTAPS
jgi:hypothetical protein